MLSAAPSSRRSTRPTRQTGLSLVELLVGVAVGLFIVGGATKLLVDYLGDSRRLLIETRVNQDLRAAADLVARDLRRSGYWQDALPGVTYPAAANPYSAASPSGVATSATVTYAYSRDAAGAENNVINTVGGQPNENFGFRLSGGAIEAQTSTGTWQQLTDPKSVQVSTFNVTSANQELSLGQYCTPTCALGSPGCPSVIVRRFDITIVGNALPPNANVQRRIDLSVRPRNDQIPIPQCP